MSAAAPAYTEVLRAIQLLEARNKKLVVMELKKTLLYYLLVEAENVLQVKGPNMEIPFYITPPALGKWIKKGDSLPDATTQKMAMGYVNNRYVVVPFGWDILEQWEIEGSPQQLFNMLDLKSSEMAWALRRTLSTAAWNGAGGKEPDGLSTFIEAAAFGAQSATFMGVPKASKAWFRNKSVQLTANFGAIGSRTTIPAGFLALMELINACTVGTMKPSHIITTKAIFDIIKRAFLETSSPHHMISEASKAEWGFETFKFNGVWIGWDPDCTDDKVYALHIMQQFDPSWTNGNPDKAKLDRDLEDVGTNSIFELSGSLGIAYHPNIRRRQIAPRTPYRQMNSTQWMVDSFNIFATRLSDHGVAYSDTGSRWSTW